MSSFCSFAGLRQDLQRLSDLKSELWDDSVNDQGDLQGDDVPHNTHGKTFSSLHTRRRELSNVSTSESVRNARKRTPRSLLNPNLSLKRSKGPLR